MPEEGRQTVACNLCSTMTDCAENSIPPGWTFTYENKRITWTCPDCSRRNIRAIEGKLPEEWWE